MTSERWAWEKRRGEKSPEGKLPVGKSAGGGYPLKGGNRDERRAARAGGRLDTTGFLALVGRFIEQANRENRKIDATQLQMAFLFAAARYNAHVAKAVLNIENHERFVETMVNEYRDMLRQHLADPELG